MKITIGNTEIQLDNQFLSLNARRDIIKQLLDAGCSAYKIAKQTGFSKPFIYSVRDQASQIPKDKPFLENLPIPALFELLYSVAAIDKEVPYVEITDNSSRAYTDRFCCERLIKRKGQEISEKDEDYYRKLLIANIKYPYAFHCYLVEKQQREEAIRNRKTLPLSKSEEAIM